MQTVYTEYLDNRDAAEAFYGTNTVKTVGKAKRFHLCILSSATTTSSMR